MRRCLADAGLGDGRRPAARQRLQPVPGRGGAGRGGVRVTAPGGGTARADGRPAADPDGASCEALDALPRRPARARPGPAEWVVAERERLRGGRRRRRLHAPAGSRLRLRAARGGAAAGAAGHRARPAAGLGVALLAETQERMGDAGSAAATRREHALVAAELTGADDGRAGRRQAGTTSTRCTTCAGLSDATTRSSRCSFDARAPPGRTPARRTPAARLAGQRRVRRPSTRWRAGLLHLGAETEDRLDRELDPPRGPLDAVQRPPPDAAAGAAARATAPGRATSRSRRPATGAGRPVPSPRRGTTAGCPGCT